MKKIVFITLIAFTSSMHGMQHLQSITRFCYRTTLGLMLFDEINAERVKEFLANGASAHTVGLNGTTALSRAVARNNAEICDLLLAAGADPNQTEGWNADPILIWATANGNHTICKALIAAGANVNLRKNKNSGSALILATLHNHPGICTLLIEAGANIHDTMNLWASRALIKAAATGERNALIHMKEARLYAIEINPAQEKNNEQHFGKVDAFGVALGHGRKMITELLLDAGAFVGNNYSNYARIGPIAHLEPILLTHICLAPDQTTLNDSKKTILHLLWCFKNAQHQLPNDVLRLILAKSSAIDMGNLMVARRLQGKQIHTLFADAAKEALYLATRTSLTREISSAINNTKLPIRINPETFDARFDAPIRNTVAQRFSREKLVCNNVRP